MTVARALRSAPVTSATPAPAAPDNGPVRKRGAATMLFTDPSGRVLIVDPTYKPRWELPGGAIEADESPAAAARREVREELGIDHAPGVLLVVDYVPASPTRTEAMITVFDGGTLPGPGGLTTCPNELRGAAFVAPEHLAEHLPALQTRRALAALEARTALAPPTSRTDTGCSNPPSALGTGVDDAAVFPAPWTVPRPGPALRGTPHVTSRLRQGDVRAGTPGRSGPTGVGAARRSAPPRVGRQALAADRSG